MSNILPGSKAVVTPTGEDLVFITQGGNPRNAKLSKLGEVLLGNEELNNDKSIKKNINDINNDIGSEEMGTTATNIKGAIKEINDTIGIINVENDGNIATQIEEINSSLKDLTQNKQDKIEDSGWLDLPIQNCSGLVGNLPQYRKVGGVVYLRGVLTNLTLSTIIGTLPVGFRPTIGGHLFLQPFTSSSYNFAKISISVTGDLRLDGASSELGTYSQISLVGLNFRVN